MGGPAAARRTIAALSASAEAFAEEPVAPAGGRGSGSGGVARNTAIFSIGTGILADRGAAAGNPVRELLRHDSVRVRVHDRLARPQLVAQLFAQSALSAAFVPVFTDLLQKGRRKEAMRLASTLFWIMLIALGAITAFFILAAGVVMPLFIGPKLVDRDGPHRGPLACAVPGRSCCSG